MKSAPDPSTQEVLAGLVERATFHNAENGFFVLRAKARGHRDLVTVVGHAAIISAGEWITASGEWTNDRAHGQQFKARKADAREPYDARRKANVIEPRAKCSHKARDRPSREPAPMAMPFRSAPSERLPKLLLARIPSMQPRGLPARPDHRAWPTRTNARRAKPRQPALR
jgi:hypothetical protein